MKKSILKVHPNDNVIVALRDLVKGEEVVGHPTLISLYTFWSSKK